MFSANNRSFFHRISSDKLQSGLISKFLMSPLNRYDFLIIIISSGLGILFGIIDSFVSAYFYNHNISFNEFFIHDYTDLWKRSLVLGICLVNGIIVIILMKHRRKTKDDLFESEEIFKILFNHSAAGIALVDLKGNYIKVNSSFYTMLGYTEEEMLKKNFRDITHPDDLHADLVYLEQLNKNEIKYFSMDKRYIHKNGSSVWAYITISLIHNSKGEPVNYTSIFNNITNREESSFIDISERDKALFEKNRSYQELNQVFNSIGVGMCLIDRNLNIARVNDAFAKLFYRNIDEIAGLKCNEVMPDALCDSKGCPLQRILNGETGCEFETKKRIDENTELTFIVTANPFVTPDNQIQGITLTFTDITEIRMLEKKIAGISELERMNLGQLLHDELGQLITGLIFRIAALKQTMKEKTCSEYEDIQIIENLMNNVQLHMRRVMIGLYPPNVEYDRLLVALQHLASETEKLFQRKCSVISDNDDILITDYNEITQLVYIASESVHNIIKHSNAENIYIILTMNNNMFTMIIKSDSKIDNDTIIKKGMGLRIMEYRARLINASFEQIIENGFLINKVHKKISKNKNH